jgi:uncharacterized heparinase superfamily protein
MLTLGIYSLFREGGCQHISSRKSVPPKPLIITWERFLSRRLHGFAPARYGYFKRVRLARTLLRLQVRQLGSLAYRRLRKSSLPRRPLAAPRARPDFSLSPPIPKKTAVGEDGRFEFLASAKWFPVRDIDWRSADMPLLWRYNLHYFDYVLDSGRTASWVASTIDDWIARNNIGSLPAWSPYVVSVRAVNWIKLFAQRPDLVSASRIASLYLHGLWLERNLEHHVLANHYLKNGQALFFLGGFFEGPDAERWRRLGLNIMAAEMRKQFLEDGGHVERSPMYHSIVLEDVLDAVNLATHANDAVPEADRAFWAATASRALDFLAAITMPDGEIPLFNDAAFGIAPQPEELFAYGRAIVDWECRTSSQPKARALPASGFYVVRDAGDMLIADCGEMGPAYQPGHAHADTLSFELVLKGRRVVVDSGVFEYEPTQERLRLRGTRAHNTVVVDGADQSELWHAFRLGRRAHPFGAKLVEGHDAIVFTGAHDGFRRLGAVVHRRTIAYDGKGWKVTDDVEGHGRHRIESLLHLHPDLRARWDSGGVRIEDSSGTAVAAITIGDGVASVIEASLYYPRFGVRRPNVRIRMTRHADLPARLDYTIAHSQR